MRWLSCASSWLSSSWLSLDLAMQISAREIKLAGGEKKHERFLLGDACRRRPVEGLARLEEKVGERGERKAKQAATHRRPGLAWRPDGQKIEKGE